MAKKADKVKNNSELAVSVDTAKNAAPAKKTNKKGSNNGEKKPNIFKRIGKGFKGVISELKKVTWPKGKEVAKSTAIVLVVVVLFFVVLFGIDYVLAGLLSLITTGEWATIFI
ncbi:MAG: preprotein translocase subunit SecE [Clostridia bacterium]|nr:preprotein translocase subunit SecE [Clostridia bacterium]MBO7325974.1 preprotein translocase subunit SecE [Clostridia bacterium]